MLIDACVAAVMKKSVEILDIETLNDVVIGVLADITVGVGIDMLVGVDMLVDVDVNVLKEVMTAVGFKTLSVSLEYSRILRCTPCSCWPMAVLECARTLHVWMPSYHV